MGADLPVYKIIFDESTGSTGANVISFVKDPACDFDFMKFNKQKNISLLLDRSKHMVTGVALRANYPIYRENEGEKFYVIFTPDVIERFAYNFMKMKRTDVVSVDHNGKEVDGVYMIESYIVNDNHKLDYKEMDGVECGSWIVSYKVDNKDVWDKVISGDVRGFSPEIDAYVDEGFKLSNNERNAIELIEFINKYN